MKIFSGIVILGLLSLMTIKGYQYYDYHYNKSLMFYVCQNDIKNAERLLKQGADVNKKYDNVAGYPIIASVFDGCPNNYGVPETFNNPRMLKLLIEYGANLNLGDNTGSTAMGHAVKKGLVNHVREILNAGITDIPTTLPEGTPYLADWISDENKLELLKQYIDKDLVDPNLYKAFKVPGLPEFLKSRGYIVEFTPEAKAYYDTLK